MRRISVTHTKEQVRNQTKTVTRRQGWRRLKTGDLLQPIEKGMGLKKGEKQVLIGPPIRVTRHYWEPIQDITPEDVIREGFPDWTPEEFVAFYCAANRVSPEEPCHVIEYEYVEGEGIAYPQQMSAKRRA